jgi:hypothetical protein
LRSTRRRQQQQQHRPSAKLLVSVGVWHEMPHTTVVLQYLQHKSLSARHCNDCPAACASRLALGRGATAPPRRYPGTVSRWRLVVTSGSCRLSLRTPSALTSSVAFTHGSTTSSVDLFFHDAPVPRPVNIGTARRSRLGGKKQRKKEAKTQGFDPSTLQGWRARARRGEPGRAKGETPPNEEPTLHRFEAGPRRPSYTVDTLRLQPCSS